MSTLRTLSADANSLRKLAPQSMFDSFALAAMGMMVVDREQRVVRISEGCRRFLPTLGFATELEFAGKRVALAGVLFVLAVYHFPSGVVGRLRAHGSHG